MAHENGVSNGFGRSAKRKIKTGKVFRTLVQQRVQRGLKEGAPFTGNGNGTLKSLDCEREAAWFCRSITKQRKRVRAAPGPHLEPLLARRVERRHAQCGEAVGQARICSRRSARAYTNAKVLIEVRW